jgi:hypothetical protein
MPQPPESLRATGTAEMPEGTPVQGRPVPMGNAAGQVPGPTRFQTVPRQVFLPPEERLRRDEEARLTTRLGAFRSAMRGAQTPEEVSLIRGLAGAPQAATLQAGRPYNLKLSSGEVVAGSYDPLSRTYLDQYGQQVDDVQEVLPIAAPRSDTPAGDKVKDASSPTGWSQVYRNDQGREIYRVQGATPYTPPPVFSSTTTVEGPGGVPTRTAITRGGETVPLGTVPDTSGAPAIQALAQGVVASIDKEIADGRIAGLPLDPGTREAIVKKYNTKYGVKWTYAQWVAQSKAGSSVTGETPAGLTPPPARPTAKPGARGAVPTNDPLGLLKP